MSLGVKTSGIDQQLFYSLMMKQLREDGFSEAAEELGAATKTQEIKQIQLPSLSQMLRQYIVTATDAPVESMTDSMVVSRVEGVSFRTEYVTKHKGPVRVARYSPDGRFACTGSADASVKVLDMSRISSGQRKPIDEDEFKISRPVVKTYQDHSLPINDAAFHPFLNLVASGSKDNSLKFFDTTKTKKAHRKVEDVFEIRSIDFHPTGDFLLVGTDDTAIRIYDVATLQGFVNPNASTNHKGPINMVRWSGDATMYTSCGKDGSIKIWDGISNECIRTIASAHSGKSVSSVSFDRSNQNIVSLGCDESIRIWNVSTGEQVRIIENGHHSEIRTNAAISYCGNFILAPNNKNNVINLWDFNSGQLVQTLSGHNNLIRCIAVSPMDQSFISCSEDCQGKFWTENE